MKAKSKRRQELFLAGRFSDAGRAGVANANNRRHHHNLLSLDHHLSFGRRSRRNWRLEALSDSTLSSKQPWHPQRPPASFAMPPGTQRALYPVEPLQLPAQPDYPSFARQRPLSIPLRTQEPSRLLHATMPASCPTKKSRNHRKASQTKRRPCNQRR